MILPARYFLKINPEVSRGKAILAIRFTIALASIDITISDECGHEKMKNILLTIGREVLQSARFCGRICEFPETLIQEKKRKVTVWTEYRKS
jgi:hypothetical protein